MTILVDARFDDYPDVDGASSGHTGTGCAPIWLIQAPGNGGANMNGAVFTGGAPVDPATGISHVSPVDDPGGTGLEVYKMTIDPNQTRVDGYLRTEFTFHSGNNNDNNAAATYMPNADSSDYWYWTALYIPEDFDPQFPLTLLQLHDSVDAPTTLDPNLILTNGEMLNSYWSGARLNKLSFRQGVSTVDGENPTTLANMERRVLSVFDPIPKGRWVEIVIRYHAHITDAIGKTQIWVDRRKMFDESRRNSYAKNYGVSLHVGLYGYWSSLGGIWAGVGNRSSIYTKGVAIGDQSYADFDAFMAALGWPAKTELNPVTRNVHSSAWAIF